MNVSQEIAALYSIGAAKDFNGTRMAFAFGYRLDEAMDDAPEWAFEITLDGKIIAAVIDVYGASKVPPEVFDVDEWDARKIHIEATANRSGFRALKQAARAILKGRKVVFPDGTSIQAEGLSA